MPNWVRNNVSFVGNEKMIETVMKSLKSGDSEISLDKMAPQPDCIKAIDWGIPSAQIILDKMLVYLTEWGTKELDEKSVHLLNKFIDVEPLFSPSITAIPELLEKYGDDGEAYPHGKAYYQALCETGSTNWYDWNIRNWGTKWDIPYDDAITKPSLENTSEEGIVKLTYVFDTAWDTPMDALKTFITRFPDVNLTVDYADEDLGNNCGTYGRTDGTLWSAYPPLNPFKFACDVWDLDSYEMCEDYGLEESS